MVIGDKVRFLNEVGGGIVTGFQGKDVVLVEDADGFDIPVRIQDCVVVNEENYRIDYSKKLSAQPASVAKPEEKPSSIKAQLNKDFKEEDKDESDKVVTYRPNAQERPHADNLNVYLCFLPVSVEELTKSNFDTYLVNDSNYYIDFTYLCGEGRTWQLRNRGTAEPNTKVYLETFSRDDLNELQHICMQLVSYKEKKPFLLKPAFSVEIRPDLTKFYKLHTFAPNDFFNERVLTYDVLRNDAPAKQVFSNAEDIREALLSSAAQKAEEDSKPHIHAIAIKKEHHEDIDIVDLHASELLDNTHGMKPADILEYQLDIFRKKMEACKKQTGKKIIFIHGKGQGVLRNAVLRELKRCYKTCSSQDASFREYGFGATMVIIH